MFKSPLLVFIPPDVDATNVNAPHFIYTASTIPTLISPHPDRTWCARSGWTEIIARTCLEGMGEFDDKETSVLKVSLKEDVSYFFLFSNFVPTKPLVALSSSETDSAPSLYEQSLYQLACAMGRCTILPPTFQVRYLPTFHHFCV